MDPKPASQAGGRGPRTPYCLPHHAYSPLKAVPPSPRNRGELKGAGLEQCFQKQSKVAGGLEGFLAVSDPATPLPQLLGIKL